MAKTFRCELDGTTIRGESDDELVRSVQKHVSENHPDLVGKLTNEQILATAKVA
jgi:hypothetical protein